MILDKFCNEFDLTEINSRAAKNPRDLLAECDTVLYGRLASAAAAIANGLPNRPVVLLAGPSGSGKTTTAQKLCAALDLIGVRAHTVSMDDYYQTVDPATHPKDDKGSIDFESPQCLDIPLLKQHFAVLSQGSEILVPTFDFVTQTRAAKTHNLRLGSNEVAIFEGIHALNPMLLDGGTSATRVYISARSNITKNCEPFFMATWMRLVRRTIRDFNFRGISAKDNMAMWANVRAGEKRYISPFKQLADITIDTALPYEVNVLCDRAKRLFSEVHDIGRGDEIRQMAARLEELVPIDESILSKKSLLREFVGGLII